MIIKGPDKICFAKKQEKKIKLGIDLDGVLVNWLKGCCEICKIDDTNKEIRNKLKEGAEIPELGLLTEGEAWDEIAKEGFEWWENLEKLPWADKLIEKCKKLGEIMFLSSPGNLQKWPKTVPDAAKGKHLWVLKHFRDVPIAICDKKEFFASPNTILIDDSAKKVKKFIEAGGNAFLWPNQYRIIDGDLELSDIFSDLEKEIGRI